MGVKSGGCGMVQIDRGDDAHGVALLRVELFGDRLVLDRARLVHVDGAGIGLVPGGDGGGGGGGVGGKGIGVVGHGRAGGFKVHEVQIAGAVQDRALVVVQTGLGLPVVLVGKGSHVVGSGLDLGIAHAVANEQKHIFGRGGRPAAAVRGGRGAALHIALAAVGGAGGAAGQDRGCQSAQQKARDQFLHLQVPSSQKYDRVRRVLL